MLRQLQAPTGSRRLFSKDNRSVQDVGFVQVPGDSGHCAQHDEDVFERTGTEGVGPVQGRGQR